MKKQTKVTNNKTSNKAPSKGFGFGDAMFAMKDIQGDYQNIANNPLNIPPPMIQQPVKNSQPIKTNPNVKKMEHNPVIKKQQITIKKQENNLSTNFKIAPGKQHTKSIKINLKQLKTLSLQKNINQLSFTNNPSKSQYYVFCQGLSAKQLVPTPQISFNYNLEDIKQGNLGNCYFICALASISHLPLVLRQRISKFKQYNPMIQKSFTVNMFQSGKYIQMPVDNSFPGVYCKPAGNDISPMILEKAYAQMYGNFQIINMGHASDALRDLTGAPTQYLDIKDQKDFKAKIKYSFQNKHVLVIATKANIMGQGVSPKHSYNILDFDEIGGQIFLKMRDPRGWTKAHFNIPAKLQAESQLMRGNGIFWIGYKDLQNNFEVISVCKVNSYNSYFFKTFDSKELSLNNNKTAGLMLQTNKPLSGTFTIHQKHKKHFDDKYSYDIIKILLAEIKIDNGQLKIVQTISGKFNTQAVCSIDVQNLKPGSYMLIGEIGNNLNKGYKLLNERFTLSLYGNLDSNQIKFSQIDGTINVKDFAISYIQNHKQQFQQTITDKGLCKYFGDFFGYVCIYYNNDGNKHVIQQIEYGVKNVQISEKKVQLKPKDKYIIMNPIGNANNCSHACSTKTKTFYK